MPKKISSAILCVIAIMVPMFMVSACTQKQHGTAYKVYYANNQGTSLLENVIFNVVLLSLLMSILRQLNLTVYMLMCILTAVIMI